MKLALHRSVTFWSGILVMGFICWAWWDSSRIIRIWSYGGWSLTTFESRLGLGRIRIGDPGWISFEDNEASSHRVRFRTPTLVRHLGGEFWKDEQVQLSRSNEDVSVAEEWVVMGRKGDWQLFIPYWLILLSVSVPWLALLIWRIKRRRLSP